jgi:hypothetical protein
LKGQAPWLEVQHHFVAAKCAHDLTRAPQGDTQEVDCLGDGLVASTKRANVCGQHCLFKEQ